MSMSWLLYYSIVLQDVTVTEQTGIHPCGSLMHDPTISVEGNRLLLTGFQPQDSGLLLKVLFSHEAQHFPCSPLGCKPKPCPEVPVSLPVLKPIEQTGLHSLWKVHLWVSESPSSHSSSLLQDLGYSVLSLHVVVQENICRVTLDHGGAQGAHVPREWLLCMSFREVEVSSSAFLVTVQLSSKHLSQICAWLGRSLHSPQLSRYTLSSRMASPPYTRLHGKFSTPDHMTSFLTIPGCMVEFRDLFSFHPHLF